MCAWYVGMTAARLMGEEWGCHYVVTSQQFLDW